MTDQVVRFEKAGEPPEKTSFDGVVAVSALRSAEARAALGAAFDNVDGVDCLAVEDEADVVGAMRRSGALPDVFFFEAADEAAAIATTRLLRDAPGGENVHICVLLPHPTQAVTLRLIKEGVGDVLSTRPDDIDVTRCLAHAAARAPKHASSGDGVKRIITFVHAAGGAGATTIAVNTAAQLAARVAETGESVCLIDFDLQFGDADIHLDLPVRSKLIEIVRTPERLDARMLDDLMVVGPNGLKVLTAPETPMPLDVFTPHVIERVITLARRQYRYVVIDMPAALTAWTEVVVKMSDLVALVTQVNVPSLRAARRLVDLLSGEGVVGDRFTVIANRYDEKKILGRRIPLDKAGKALAANIDTVVPSEYALLVESLDQGVPAVTLKNGAKFGAEIDAFIGRSIAKDAVRKDAKPSLFKFGRG